MDWAWKNILKAPGPKMQNLDTPPASWVAACMLHHLRQFLIHTIGYGEGHILQNPVTRQAKSITNQPAAKAAYSALGLLQHDCYPNTFNVCHADGVIQLIAWRPIKKSEVITTSVMDSFLRAPLPARQQIVRRLYNRTCDCTACTENWPTLEEVIGEGKPKYCLCRECGKEIPLQRTQRQTQRMCQCSYDEVQAPRMAECDRLIAKYIQLKDRVVEWSMSTDPEPRERAIKTQCELLDEMDRMLPRACWIHMDTYQSVGDVFAQGRGSKMIKMACGRGAGLFGGLF